MNKIYAGIGARKTSHSYMNTMRKLAIKLSKLDYTLRSGAAGGADSAFEKGADKLVTGKKEIWLPWLGFNGHDSPLVPNELHFEIASQIHPAWEYLTPAVKALHARNVGEILGEDGDTPVDFVICYTEDGAETYEQVTKKTGGTGTAIRLACQHNIRVYNLKNYSSYLELVERYNLKG